MTLEPQSLQEAQSQADRIRILREELAALEGSGVLTLNPEQRLAFDRWSESTLQRLAARFDVDTTASQKNLSWGMRIASTLGGLALCAAVVLFFNRYWGYLTTSLQVGIAILAPLAALAATEWVARRERTLYFAGLLALVALACFFMNLAVVGSAFNMVSTEGSLLAWGVFAMLLAYRYGLRPLLVAGLGLLVMWASALLTTRLGHNWMQFGERPEHFALAGLLVFLAPLVIAHRRNADFPAVYRLAGLLAFFIPLLMLASYGDNSHLPFAVEAIEQLYEVAGLLAASGAVALGIRRHWNGVVNCAAVFFVVFLYSRLHRWFWDLLPKYLFFALIGAIAIALVFGFRRLRERMKQEGVE